MNQENIRDLWTKFFKFAQALGIIATGITFGTYFGPFFYNLTRLGIKHQISLIKTQIDSISSVIDSDTVNYKNWIANHTNPVLFNSTEALAPFVIIGNYTTGECEFLKDSVCCGKWVRAKTGDVLLVQMSFKNTNKFEIKGVAIKLNYHIDSIKNVDTIYGRLLMGNHVFLDDSVKIYSNRYMGQFGFSQILAIQDNKSALIEQKSTLTAMSEYGLTVGNMKPNSSKMVTFSIRM